MNFIIKILISGAGVYLTAMLLPGVTVNGFVTALIVAVVISLLNMFVKPVFTFLTLPITVVTLGLFLLLINSIMVYFAGVLVSGFTVDGILWAIIFGFVNSVIMSVLESFFSKKK